MYFSCIIIAAVKYIKYSPVRVIGFRSLLMINIFSTKRQCVIICLYEALVLFKSKVHNEASGPQLANTVNRSVQNICLTRHQRRNIKGTTQVLT